MCDNLNDCYDVRLKEWRLKQLENYSLENFLSKIDIEKQQAKLLFKITDLMLF